MGFVLRILLILIGAYLGNHFNLILEYFDKILGAYRNHFKFILDSFQFYLGLG